MCVVSMIFDYEYDKWKRNIQPWKKYPYDPNTPYVPPYIPTPQPKLPTQEEIDEFYELLKRAKKYDKENNQKDCETEEKKKKLKDLAKELGILDKIKFIDED